MTIGIVYKFKIVATVRFKKSYASVVEEIFSLLGQDDVVSKEKLTWLVKSYPGAVETVANKTILTGDVARLDFFLPFARLSQNQLNTRLSFVLSPRCRLISGIRKKLNDVLVKNGACIGAAGASRSKSL